MFQARIESWTHGPVVRDLYGTFKPYGDDASGVSLAEWLDAIDPATVDGVGLNCGEGPGGLAAPLSALGSRPWLVSCAPGAGLSNDAGTALPPEPFAQTVAAYAAAGLVHIAGGCCGTTPAHIRALAAAIAPPGVVATPGGAGTQ
jgi:5-methyltetrahydrofolate--homocysteine methyltransferase